MEMVFHYQEKSKNAKTVKTKVTVNQPTLQHALWAYGTGQKRRLTGYKEDTYGYLEITGLENQDIIVKVWVKGENENFYTEPEKYMLEEKKVSLNAKGKAQFMITTTPKYKEIIDCALPQTSSVIPKHSLVFTISLPPSTGGSITLPKKLNILHANEIKENLFEVLVPNETLTLTSEQLVTSITFANQASKDQQRGLTHYTKSHKIWVHTANMQDQELEVEVMTNTHSDCMDEKDGIIKALESIKSYPKKKVGSDGSLELDFTLEQKLATDAQTNPTYYAIQVAKKAKDPSDDKKEIVVFVKDQLIVHYMPSLELVRSQDLKSIGIKTDKTGLSPEEKAALRKRFIAYNPYALIVTDSTKTKEAIDNTDVLVMVDDIEDIEVAEIVSNSNCGEKYCIKKGDKSELIKEVNIRLAGFGGNAPTDEFTDRTEKMIKQFQKDYMKVPETGKICGNVLKAIDDFSTKWIEKILDYKCLCHASDSKVAFKDRCPSFGKGLKDEHPGVHRVLLWGVSALKFYLSKQSEFSYFRTSAGYRCWAHNNSIPRTSTNHMGKAVDIQFAKNGINITGKDKSNIPKLDSIRDSFYIKYLKAVEGWSVPKKSNLFRLEPIGLLKDQSYSWIHMDVTTYNDYLLDNLFVKEQSLVMGKKIVEIARELNLTNLCSCGGTFNTNENTVTKSKYKWSHSAFGNIIANKESNNNYNICNKTKGGLVIVNNVKVIETKIKDIVQKQEDRDVFAVGRYQLIPKTLNAAISSLSLDIEKNLDEEIQDKIFDDYLIKVKRPKIIKYLEGNGSVEDAMYESAKEWASIGVEKGKQISDKKITIGKKVTYEDRFAEGGESYYAGDGLNKAHISPEEIKESLITSKK